MATYRLTVLSTTFLWDRNSTTGIIDPYPHEDTAAPGGPYNVSPIIVPFDPIHKTGGSFWFLTSGPDVGMLISQHTNDLGYGSILLENVTGTPFDVQTHVNPLAPWRLLVKGMGGDTGLLGANQLTFNSATDLWSRTTTGIINYDRSIAEFQGAGTGGPYAVNPIVVPFDPEHETGGSFYRLLEGPYTGWLVSFWSNSLGYGDITVVQEEGFDRGPGEVIATFGPGDVVPTLATGTGDKKAHLVGASLIYNAAGEMHFTLLNDHPLVRVPFPKTTHYAIEFWNVDTEEWDETFAGLIWDFDATDTEVVFYGIDYLALYQYTIDERFDLLFSEKAAPAGSKYVDRTITDIITSHIAYSQSRPNSLVGFIATGDIAAMAEKVTIYSTYQDTLSFVSGLIDSHRAGTGKQTRMKVVKIGGVYTFTIEDDPGLSRDNLALEYGDLAQGYRIVPFGVEWASRVNYIARDIKTGQQLKIVSDSSAVDQGVWGRIGQPPVIVNVIDTNDLKRRALQAAIDASRFGRQIGIGLKLGSFRPLEGYDICDEVPVVINHGAVQTENWGSDDFGIDTSGDPSGSMAAYWSILGILWESYDDSHWMTNLILYPRGRRPLGSSSNEQFGHNADVQAQTMYTWPKGAPGEGLWLLSFYADRSGPGVPNAGSFPSSYPDTNILSDPIADTEYTNITGFSTITYGNPGGGAAAAWRDSTEDDTAYARWNAAGWAHVYHLAIRGLDAGAPAVVVSDNGDPWPSQSGSPSMPCGPITISEPGYIFFGFHFDTQGPHDRFGWTTYPDYDVVAPWIKLGGGWMNQNFGGYSMFGYIYVTQAMLNVTPTYTVTPTLISGAALDGNEGYSFILMHKPGPESPRFDAVLGYQPDALTNDIPLTSEPIIPRTPIGVGHGPPDPTSNPANVQTYTDLDTGQVWQWDDDTEEWSPVGMPSTWAMTDPPGGPPGLDGEDGEPGPMGPPGQDGAAGVAGAVGADGANGQVPYYIPLVETYTVIQYRQALFSETIEADGNLVVDGHLVEVD